MRRAVLRIFRRDISAAAIPMSTPRASSLPEQAWTGSPSALLAYVAPKRWDGDVRPSAGGRALLDPLLCCRGETEDDPLARGDLHRRRRSVGRSELEGFLPDQGAVQERRHGALHQRSDHGLRKKSLPVRFEQDRRRPVQCAELLLDPPEFAGLDPLVENRSRSPTRRREEPVYGPDPGSRDLVFAAIRVRHELIDKGVADWLWRGASRVESASLRDEVPPRLVNGVPSRHRSVPECCVRLGAEDVVPDPPVVVDRDGFPITETKEARDERFEHGVDIEFQVHSQRSVVHVDRLAKNGATHLERLLVGGGAIDCPDELVGHAGGFEVIVTGVLPEIEQAERIAHSPSVF